MPRYPLPGFLDYVYDYDGNIYTTIVIGTRRWLVENLKTTRYSDGTPIPNITNGALWVADTTGAYCWFNNDPLYFDTPFGALYNWYAVNNIHGLAPQGYRIPNDADFTDLANTLGGLIGAGGKIKFTGLTYWVSPNTGASNSSGFSFPGMGYRDETVGGFYGPKYYGWMWSTSTYSASQAYSWYSSFNNANMGKNYYDKNVGFSVRCCKNA